MKPPIRVCITYDHRLFFDVVQTMLRRQDACTDAFSACRLHSVSSIQYIPNTRWIGGKQDGYE